MAGLDTIVSGLDAATQWMNVISNNLANLDTTGFKGQTVSFEDLLSENIAGASAPSATTGGVAPVQIGLGVQRGAILANESQGSIEQTGVQTDVAIQGGGFLVLQQGANTVYSRDGQLSVDANNNLVQASTGGLVEGWTAANGVVTAQGVIAPISLANAQQVPPAATTQMNLLGNLQAGATTAQPLLATVYDSLGNPLTVSFSFTPVGAGQWSWAATLPSGGTIAAPTGAFGGGAPFAANPTIPAGSTLGGGVTYTIQETATGDVQVLNGATVVAVAAGAGGTGAGGAVTFDDVIGGVTSATVAMTADAGAGGIPAASGAVQALGTITVTAAGSGTMTFNAQGVLTAQTGGPLTITPTDGAAAVAATLNLGSVTQFASASTVALGTQNGAAPGTLQSFQIGPSGVLTGSYSNGVQQAIAQIALATFINPQGLSSVGQNQLAQSPDSGVAAITAPGTGSAGTLAGGALEESNVDMSDALTQVIQAQSSYQADARTITAITAMQQAAIQMVP